MDRAQLSTVEPLATVYYALRYYAFNARLAVAARRDARANDGQTLPPPRLRHRVHGRLDRESFVEVGRTVAQDIRDACTAIGLDINSCAAILDFGCGCGRVIRYLTDLPETCEVYGADIDAELIDWCQTNLAGVEWSLIPPDPPTEYEPDKFDLILAVSVFTHLDEGRQFAWLEELCRIMKPGGVGLFSVHGKFVTDQLAPSLRERTDADGFSFQLGAVGRHKRDRLPDFYQRAYHRRGYVEAEWSRLFEVERYIDRGINRHQDLVVVRKGVGDGTEGR